MPGILNDAQAKKYVAHDAIAAGGFLVSMRADHVGEVVLCDGSLIAFGITLASTKDPITHIATADRPVSVFGLVPGYRVELQVPGTHAAIDYGNLLMTNTGGTVLLDDGGAGLTQLVAIADQDLGENIAGPIKAIILPMLRFVHA